MIQQSALVLLVGCLHSIIHSHILEPSIFTASISPFFGEPSAVVFTFAPIRVCFMMVKMINLQLRIRENLVRDVQEAGQE
nr:hypothetical protein [Tanacetum cinerariifolium]